MNIKKIKNKILLIIVTISLSMPFMVYAKDFEGAVLKIISYSKTITEMLIVASFAFFFWGIFMMVASGDSSAAKESAKTRITWGLAILFVLFSVWTILAFMTNTTNLDQTKIEVDITNLPGSLGG